MAGQNGHDELDLYDITLIGAGPTGLFGAFYAGLREMRTKIIETLPEVGGQLAVLYPEKFIYDVPGFPKILARDLVKDLREQMDQFRPTICLSEQVLNLEHTDGHMVLTTSKGKHYTKTLVICSGIGAFHPNKMDNPSINRFEGNGVFYHVPDKAIFRGKNLLIVGGGDSALDWALTFKDWARHVTLVHRRDVFRAHESSVAALFASPVEVKLFWEIKEVLGDKKIQKVVIVNNKTKEEQTIDVDAILLNLGFKADIGPIREWGLEVVNRSIVVSGAMETNIPGVYAAGDISDPKNSIQLNLIVTGFAQAAIAVNCAKNFIDPKERIFPGHSSEMKL
ncbi:MAG: NAD(P)/FAD-dependent oxidoreductase [Chloroflexi bacterium]|nr:NAD(P)/FAD-dependent oxidoreductase [Chloroflexota bacterium]